MVKNGKTMRCGCTTGSCAAAASKAAVIFLFSANVPKVVNIDTPKGLSLTLRIEDWERGEGWVRCGVRKDGGDDPDVTSGLIVYSKVETIDRGEIIITAGEGIGMVTRPGLQVEVGQPAINPVPRAMILKEVQKVLPLGGGVKITLSVPGGEKVAKKTFNSRLGVKDGISIIGTTGIVEPMSVGAFMDTLVLELSMLSACGHRKVVLVPGNYGKYYAVKNGIDESRIVSYGNFVGLMLEKSVECGFEEVRLIGDIGKLIKVAAGIFNTTSRIADARTEIMAAYAAHFGVGNETIDQILNSNTTEEGLEVIGKAGIDIGEFSKFVAERIVQKCRWYTGDKLSIKVDLISLKRGLLARVG